MSDLGGRRGEQTREAILTAAEIVFAEHGFDGSTGYLAHPFEVSHHKTERQGDKNRLY